MMGVLGEGRARVLDERTITPAALASLRLPGALFKMDVNETLSGSSQPTPWKLRGREPRPRARTTRGSRMVATMIKFVCATCRERLSVSEQFAGRKGACPSCGSINRVPLRGFAETRGTTLTRSVAQSRMASRASASVKTREPELIRAGSTLDGTSHTAGHKSANGFAHAHGNGHTGQTSAPMDVTAPSYVDRRGRIEPAVAPSPVPRRTSIPPVQPVHVAIPHAPVPTAETVDPGYIKLHDAAPAVSSPSAASVATSAYATSPIADTSAATSLVAPDTSSGSTAGHSFLAAAVAALPEHVAETHVHVFAQRHTLAADQLTPGERWRQAFASEDQQPSRWGRILPWGRKSSAGAAESAFAANLDDESIPTAVKIGLLLGGVLCLVGVIYGVLHLMLWVGAGVK